MTKQERKHYFMLTALISRVIFCIQLVTILLASTTIYILVQTDIVSITGEARPNIGRMIIFMMLISSIVGAVVSFISSRIPMKPLNHIIGQINRLASGDFKARLSFGRTLSNHPSFTKLSESFNMMAMELENTEMLRGDFINNFSHEFKTPIVSIAGFAKVLKRGNLTEEQKDEYLSVIEEESLRLSYMATNVLNLTRVENQKILTDISSFNLSEQLRSCILLLVDKWEKKQLDFKIDFSEHMISANEELLKQVWINLIDNAIKFSPDGDVIELSINDDGNSISVYVINFGEEISLENQERIFNKFYQADNSHSSKGNGIGLAIVKRVVDLHKGTVSVKSENNVAMFTVTLPEKQ